MVNDMYYKVHGVPRPPKLFVVMGVQGSGKSAIIKSHFSTLVSIASDDWFEVDEEGCRYWTDRHGTKKSWSRDLSPYALGKAWAWVWQKFGALLQEKKSFVFEGTFPTRISRSPVINLAKAFGYEVECIWVNTSLEHCLENNNGRKDRVPDTVIARTFASTEYPKWEEGWDNIQSVYDWKEGDMTAGWPGRKEEEPDDPDPREGPVI